MQTIFNIDVFKRIQYTLMKKTIDRRARIMYLYTYNNFTLKIKTLIGIVNINYNRYLIKKIFNLSNNNRKYSYITS